MKYERILLASLLASAYVAPAVAETSVRLYGLIDSGVTYISNAGGSSAIRAQDSTIQGDRWGLMGTEDLGNGLKAVFQLENGFNLFNGKVQQGGRLFGRQARLGISSDRWGTLSFGRMYDSYVDFIQPVTAIGGGGWGSLAVRPGDIDNTNDSFRINNAVKYTSARIDGFTFGGMYAFGGDAGSVASNSSYAGGLNYVDGGWTFAGGYFYAHDPATQFSEAPFNTTNTNTQATTGPYGYVGRPASERLVGAGAAYSGSVYQFGGTYTNSRFSDAIGSGTSVIFNSYQIWANYFLTPVLKFGAAYSLTTGSIGYDDRSPKYHQFNLGLDYFLSKRTDVYIQGVYQKTGGGANASIYNVFTGTSSTDHQLVTRVGLRTRF
ncbi:porin [Achromobacter aloeverae]